MRWAALFAFVSLIACLLLLSRMQAQGAASSPAATLELHGNGQLITAGSYHPQRADGSDFGPALVAQGPARQEFQLHNPMPTVIQLGPRPGWFSEGPQAGEFRLATALPQQLLPGEVRPFVVHFQPQALGLRTTMLRIPCRSQGAADEVKTLDFRLQGQGVGLGSLQVRAGEDSVVIQSGEVISDLLHDHWAAQLPSHVLFDAAGALELRLSNRAQDSLLPIYAIELSGPAATDFILDYDRDISQLQSSEELMLRMQFRPTDHSGGIRQAVLRVATADAVTPQFEVLLLLHQGPGSDG